MTKTPALTTSQSFHQEVQRGSKVLGVLDFHTPTIFTGFRL